MATPLTAAAIVSALKAEGVKVAEYKSWRTHNRNRAGAWGPVHGVMIHHTVSAGTARSVELCYAGHSSLPGPLCHGVIDKAGTVHMVGHGRTNHAGKGDGTVLDAVIGERALPTRARADTDGNPHFYGFECVNLGDGKDPWPAVQVEAAVRAAAALLRAHGWGKSGDTSVIGHLEWQPGKIDPRGPGVSMSDIRRRVAARLKHTAGWSPGDTTPQEDPVPEHVQYETKGLTRSIPGGEERKWTTLTFNRRRQNDGGWENKAAEPSLIFGPCRYMGSFAVRAAGLPKGRELQLRMAHFVETSPGSGKWELADAQPIDSPVHDSGKGHHVYTWNGYLPGERRGRLRVQVLNIHSQPIEIDWAMASFLYWPTP